MAGLPRLMPAATGYDLGEVVVCPCSWGVNGTSDPATSSIKGDIISTVTYSAAGEYTVTLRNIGYTILAAHPTVQLTADNVDLYAQLGDVNTSELTVKIKLKTGATNTAPPASNANSRIHLTLFMARNSVARRR